MADHLIQAGSSSNRINIKIRDSATGQLKTGLVAASFSAASYTRTGTTTTMSLVDGTLGSYGSANIKETTQGGTYEFGIPNNCVLSGALESEIVLKGTGIIDVGEHVLITGQANSLPTADSSNQTKANVTDINSSGNTANAAILALSMTNANQTSGALLSAGWNNGTTTICPINTTFNATSGSSTLVIKLNTTLFGSAVSYMGSFLTIPASTVSGINFAGQTEKIIGVTTGATPSFTLAAALAAIPPNGTLLIITTGVGSSLVASDTSGALLMTSATGNTLQTGVNSISGSVGTLFTTVGTISVTVSTNLDTTISSRASSTQATTINNNVLAITTNTARGKIAVPYWLVRPSTGTNTFQITVNIYSLQGLMEDPDSNAVTMAVKNSAGTSLNSSLSSTTMTKVSTGTYTVNFTVASTDTAQEATFTATWAINSQTISVADSTEIQDAELTSVTAQISASVATLTSRIPGTVQPQTGDSYARLGAPTGASTNADIAAVKAQEVVIQAKTDLIGTNTADSPNQQSAQQTVQNIFNDTEELVSVLVLWTDQAVQDNAATTTSFVTNLGSVDVYSGLMLCFTSGANAGSGRQILSYNTGTKRVTLKRPLPVTPSNSDFFSLGTADFAELDASQTLYTPAKAGDGMALTTAERTATALVVDAQANSTLAATNSTSIKVVTDKEATTLENDTSNPGKSRLTAASLFNAPSGGGSGGSVTVNLLPVIATAALGATISDGIPLDIFQNESKTFTITIVDQNGNPISQSGITFRFIAETEEGQTTVFAINSGISVTGTGNNIINIPVTSANSNTAVGELQWRLWNVTDTNNPVIAAWGVLNVIAANLT